MVKILWNKAELQELKSYCRARCAEDFRVPRPIDCRELYIVPHNIFVEWTDEDGRKRNLPLEKGEMVCRDPFSPRCGLRIGLRAGSDGTISGYCMKKAMPIKLTVKRSGGLL